MAFSVSFTFTAIDKFSATAKRLKKDLKGLRSVAMRVNQTFRKTGDRLKAFGRSTINAGKALSLGLTTPILLLGFGAIKASANLETLRTSFIGILGSAKKAKAVVSDLVEFTAKTPFQLAGVAKSAKQLLAANVEAGRVKRMLQVLGDISAAANVPLTDMAQIFAKIKNKGKAMTEELLQLSDRGIPIIDILAKKFNTSKNVIFKAAEKGKLSFKVMRDALINMTKKGGFANRAMILQSKTLTGVISTLKDNVILMAASFGDLMLPIVKKIALRFIDISQKVKTFVSQNKELVKIGLMIAAGLAVLGPLLIGTGFAISVIGVAIGGLATVMGLLFGWVGIIIVGLAALSILVVRSIGSWNELKAAAIGFGKGFMQGIRPAIAIAKETLIPAFAKVKTAWFSLTSAIFGSSKKSKTDFVSWGETIGSVIGSVVKGLATLISFFAKVAAFSLGGISKIAGFFGIGNKAEQAAFAKQPGVATTSEGVAAKQSVVAKTVAAKQSVIAKAVAANGTFSGELGINIRDKGGNVESASLKKSGDLDTGLNLVGI